MSTFNRNGINAEKVRVEVSKGKGQGNVYVYPDPGNTDVDTLVTFLGKDLALYHLHTACREMGKDITKSLTPEGQQSKDIVSRPDFDTLYQDAVTKYTGSRESSTDLRAELIRIDADMAAARVKYLESGVPPTPDLLMQFGQICGELVLKKTAVQAKLDARKRDKAEGEEEAITESKS